MVNTITQRLTSMWQSFFDERHSFNDIIGHEDIKKIFPKAIPSKRPLHILLVGSPGSAKTMFLTEIMQTVKQSYFTVGSNTTKSGLINQLFERRPKFLLIDELEKMNSTDQTSLLHLMETGIISETKMNKTRQMELTSWVFATVNSHYKIIEPLLSRFAILQLPEYTFEEFSEIAVKRLAKEDVDNSIAKVIAEKVWNELGSRDIRDVVRVARLGRNLQEIPFVIKMLGGGNNLGRKTLH